MVSCVQCEAYGATSDECEGPRECGFWHRASGERVWQSRDGLAGGFLDSSFRHFFLNFSACSHEARLFFGPRLVGFASCASCAVMRVLTRSEERTKSASGALIKYRVMAELACLPEKACIIDFGFRSCCRWDSSFQL